MTKVQMESVASFLYALLLDATDAQYVYEMLCARFNHDEEFVEKIMQEL